MRWFNPCKPCCQTTLKIGFETMAYLNAVACNDYEYIEYLAQDISRINECKAVFLNGACNKSTLFQQEDWATIAEWLSAGGRLYATGEHLDCQDLDQTTTNRDRFNQFINYIGGHMTVGAKACNCNCDPKWTGNINAAVPMLENVEAILHACTNEVIGGTWLAQTNYPDIEYKYLGEPYDCTNPVPFIAMEQVGRGYLILAGDGNILDTNCGYNNCALWRAFIENKANKML